MKYFLVIGVVVLIGYFSLGLLTPSIVDDSYRLEGSALSGYLEETSDMLASSGTLRYFGFAIVDCTFDDPMTDDVETSYFDEVKDFSNIVHSCAFTPDSDVTDMLAGYQRESITGLLYVENILFERAPSGDLSGEIVTLREDYRDRWERFEHLNRLADWTDSTVLYLVDEPLWNSVSSEELNEVSEYLKERLPDTRQFTVYSYAMVNEEMPKPPTSLDWLGYNQYGIPNPLMHEEYQSDLDVLEAVINPGQEIIIIFESMWHPLYSRYDFEVEHLPTMTAHYYRLGVDRERVTGLIGYVWPNGFDGREFIGARSLTQLHPLYQYMFDSIEGE